MQFDLRPFVGRLRWIRHYPPYGEAPARFAWRAMKYTWREQAGSGETVAFDACGGHSFRSPRNNVSSFIAAVFDHRDLNIVRFWERSLAPGAVFFDVGANIGLYSVPASFRVGAAGRVVCFEAHPVMCGFLRANVARNCGSNVTVENVAVGSVTGSARMAFNRSNPGETRVALDEEAGEAVAMVTLDEYCARSDIARIDYMKIDVEGYESTVLRGARRIVEASPDILIQTEYEPLHLARYGSASELGDILTQYGLRPHRIDWAGRPVAVTSLADFSGEVVWSRHALHA